jgi:uncharacterized protein with von Willebrand factor type A (vWA) domain
VKSVFIFLVDRSGSMSGSAISRVKNALHLFLRSLPSDSYFNIIGFGSTWKSLFEDTVSVTYSNHNLQIATKHVNSIEANYGGTELFQPLEFTQLLLLRIIIDKSSYLLMEQ